MFCFHAGVSEVIVVDLLIFPYSASNEPEYPLPTHPCEGYAVTPDRCKKETSIYEERSTSFLRRPWYCFFSASVWKAP